MVVLGMASYAPGLCAAGRGLQSSRVSSALSLRLPMQQRHHRPVDCRSQEDQQIQQQPAAPDQSQTLRVALGAEVVESDEDFPEPASNDFWEGEAWDWFGKLAIVIVPVLIGLAVLVGLFAAATYNTGADQILKPAGENTPAEIVDK